MKILFSTMLSSLLLLLFFNVVHSSYDYHLFKSKFNKLRHITLKDDAFCEAYQEFRDNNCVAKLTFCSPLTDDQVLQMRQILCGPKFNPDVQPPPHIHELPEITNETDPSIILNEHPPPYFLDIPPSQPNSFPWLAAVYNNDRKFLCAGALVSPKTVITSAQCVTESSGAGAGADASASAGAGADASAEAEVSEENQRQQASASFFVRFGRHNLNVSSVYDKAYEYDVESIEISQQFNKNTLENDFAILKLVSPVCNFLPIALPKRDDWENGYYFGARASVLYTGWGLGHYQKPYLRSLSSHLIPRDTCSKKFNWAPDQLSNTHMCVIPPINVCVGGIGTPLVAYSHHHCVLLGLMSMGDHCNTPKLPLVFTKVSTFIDEIERIIEEDFKSMNETTPLEDCIRMKHLHSHQPYFIHPPFHFADIIDYDFKHKFPKSYTQY